MCILINVLQTSILILQRVITHAGEKALGLRILKRSIEETTVGTVEVTEGLLTNNENNHLISAGAVASMFLTLTLTIILMYCCVKIKHGCCKKNPRARKVTKWLE